MQTIEEQQKDELSGSQSNLNLSVTPIKNMNTNMSKDKIQSLEISGISKNSNSVMTKPSNYKPKISHRSVYI